MEDQFKENAYIHTAPSLSEDNLIDQKDQPL